MPLSQNDHQNKSYQSIYSSAQAPIQFDFTRYQQRSGSPGNTSDISTLQYIFKILLSKHQYPIYITQFTIPNHHEMTQRFLQLHNSFELVIQKIEHHKAALEQQLTTIKSIVAEMSSENENNFQTVTSLEDQIFTSKEDEMYSIKNYREVAAPEDYPGLERTFVDMPITQKVKSQKIVAQYRWKGSMIAIMDDDDRLQLQIEGNLTPESGFVCDFRMSVSGEVTSTRTSNRSIATFSLATSNFSMPLDTLIDYEPPTRQSSNITITNQRSVYSDMMVVRRSSGIVDFSGPFHGQVTLVGNSFKIRLQSEY